MTPQLPLMLASLSQLTKIPPSPRDSFATVYSHIFNLNAIADLAQREDAPLFVMSKKKIASQYQILQHYFPKAKHHYAVKSSPLACTINALKGCDAYFDVASNGEIDLLSSCGVTGDRCIHTHPIKSGNSIEKAVAFGIKTFVFDNAYELEKLLPYKDEVKLLMRLSFSNNLATFDLSSKFGVAPEASFQLLSEALSMGFSVVGATFHVGSQMPDYNEYIKALTFCTELYTYAESMGKPFSVLDIGGGFPDETVLPASQYAAYFEPIAQYIDSNFKNITVYTEPGRFVTAAAGLSVTKVIGKNIRNGVMSYYLNDGVYGSFSGIVFDKHIPNLFTHKEINGYRGTQKKSCLFGPTCDSFDVVVKEIALPELEVGDILFCTNIGAYSLATVTNFNMLSKAKIIALD